MRMFILAAAMLAFASVADAQCLLTYETESLAPYFVNTPGNQQIVAVSGAEPYKFEIIHGDPLPEGFHLTPSGRLVGVPRQELEQVILVTVTDAAGCQLTQAFYLIVFPESGPPA